jgi:hypothetical protein
MKFIVLYGNIYTKAAMNIYVILYLKNKMFFKLITKFCIPFPTSRAGRVN